MAGLVASFLLFMLFWTRAVHSLGGLLKLQVCSLCITPVSLYFLTLSYRFSSTLLSQEARVFANCCYHAAVTTLLSFACSPCLRSRFLADKTLEIRYASVGRSRAFENPKPEQWNEVSRAALDSQNENPHPNDPSPYPQFSNKDLNCLLHCEVALALHYFSRHPDDPPALPCIGVSKLSCFACWSFLTCIRGVGVNFSTRGTNVKTYFPWRYPGEELGVPNYAHHAGRIHDNLYSIFAERYATCVRSRRMVTGLGFKTNEGPDAYWYAWVAVERKRKEHAELDLGVDDAGRHRKRLKRTGETN